MYIQCAYVSEMRKEKSEAERKELERAAETRVWCR